MHLSIFKLLLIYFLVLSAIACPTSRSFISCEEIKQDYKLLTQVTIDMNREIKDYEDPGANPRHDPRFPPPHVQLTSVQKGLKNEEEIKRDYKSLTQGTIDMHMEIKDYDDPKANPRHDPRFPPSDVQVTSVRKGLKTEGEMKNEPK